MYVFQIKSYGMGYITNIQPATRPTKLYFTIASLAMRLFPNFKIDTELKPEYITSDERWHEFLSADKIINPLIGSLRQIYDFLSLLVYSIYFKV